MKTPEYSNEVYSNVVAAGFSLRRMIQYSHCEGIKYPKQSLSLHKLLIYLCSLSIILNFSVMVASAQEKVVVYSPFKNELMGRLGQAFKTTTGIELQNKVISTGETYARIKAERNKPLADIWLSVRALYLKQASEEKDSSLIEVYKSPNIKSILPRYFYGGEYHITGVGMYPLIFFYNPVSIAKIKTEPPKNYEDLLDVKYKGNIVMPHPATSGTGLTFLTTILQVRGDEKGWAYLERLMGNMALLTKSGRGPHKMIAVGEIPVGIGFWDDVYLLAKEGNPIKPVFPDPVYAEPYCMAIIKNAPHPEAAKKFFDFMLAKEAQEIIVKENGDYSVRPDVSPPGGGAIPIKQMNMMKDDYIWAAKNKKQILDKFTSIIDKTNVKIDWQR